MSKNDSGSPKKEQKKPAQWALIIFIATLFVSGAISLMSEAILAGSGMVAAFLILLAIVAVGILFDVVGVAVTSAQERPFHSMASRKVPGAQESIKLLRNAEKVSSICNDVVGDICGVVSGAASAAIAARVITEFSVTWPKVVTLAMSAMIAGLTVGGKAIGKSFAIGSSTEIVHTVGRLLHSWNEFNKLFRKNRKS